MPEEKLARLRAHRSNIARYQSLLATGLTKPERLSLERRLQEEQTAMDALTAAKLPLAAPGDLPVPEAGV